MAAPPITPDSLLVNDALGWHQGDDTITYSFISSVPGYYPKVDTDDDGVVDSFLIDTGDEGSPDFTVPIGASVAISKKEVGFARAALKEWASVANLNLVEVKPGPGVKVADITLGAYAFADENTYGFVGDIPDAGTGARLGQPSRVGDFWLNRGMPDQGSADYGNTGWQTYLHELGHALGLHHPDDEGEPASPIPRHNNQYTVMSYVAHPSMASLPDDAQDWPITPMLYDIAALQSLYGANLDTRAENTTYFGPGAGSAYALRDGGLLANGRTAILTVWDGGGTDTIDASNQTAAVKIDLNPGAFSTIGAFADNVAMALAVTVEGVVVNLIENATGGRGNDSLVGNVGDNVLDGRGGADTLRGGRGNDTYVVDNARDKVFEAKGQGKDILVATTSYALAAGQEVETLQFAKSTGSKAFALTGNEFAQTLIGNAGANTLDGGLGGDLLTGRGGADSFVFASKLGSGNVDRIADFSDEDTIRLDDAIFRTLTAGQLSDGLFKNISTGKADANDQILYKQATGQLFYDADGFGKGAAVLFAVLDNKVALSAADILVA